MGKKGAKRKTRWRTLSIGTPPGEEDEEEGSRHGGRQVHQHQQHSGNSSSSAGAGGRERSNGYGYGSAAASWLKSRHGSAGSSGSGNGSTSNGAGSTTSGYASGGSRSRRDDSGNGDPNIRPDGQKRVFNENEYTRITTPRQDILFKKGYLSQRKPWTSAASMSATPSTTESRSASHSTADGSEAAEDQQLLDASSAVTLMLESPPQFSYGTYYDHTSGYYYECPMMLVGPAVPEPLAPSVLAAMPCDPVPLRPIEWVNPAAYVPKLAASQQYCYVDYQQTAQGTDCAALVDAQGVPLTEPVPLTNGLSDVVEDLPDEHVIEESAAEDVTALQAQEPVVEPLEHLDGNLAPTEALEYVETTTPYVETLPPTQSVHLAHVIPQPLGQPYIYPGQYMFGPPVANVNGVTIQSGPMLRYNDMVASSATIDCVKRRRKKKKKKQKRFVPFGNTDEDEEDYSSEGENGFPCPRSSSWSTTTMAPVPSFSNRPLNPECQEFHLRSAPTSGVFVNDESVVVAEDAVEQATEFAYTATLAAPEMNGNVAEYEYAYGEEVYEEEGECAHQVYTIPVFANHMDNHSKRLIEEESKAVVISGDEVGAVVTGSYRAQDSQPLTNGDVAEVYVNGGDSLNYAADTSRLPESYEARANTTTITTNVANSNGASAARRKYSGKSLKFAREATPGLMTLDDALASDDLAAATTIAPTSSVDDEKSVDEVTTMLGTTSIVEAQPVQNDGDLDICQTWVNESSITSESCCNENNETTTTITTTTTATTTRPTTDEDSGFESQSRLRSSDRPITDAVNEWLKRVNSPGLFITSSATSDTDSEDEEEDDDEEDAGVSNEPSKNLQGNPMLALSVSGCAEVRQSSSGKFASPQDRVGVKRDENEKLPLVRVSSEKSRNRRGAKKKGAKASKRNRKDRDFYEKRENKDAVAQGHTYISVEMISSVKTSNSPLEKKSDGICECTDKDSDAGMRVAKNSRIDEERDEDPAKPNVDAANCAINRVQEDVCIRKCIGNVLPVKTFEKGEIVVSMDGELLLVAPVLDEKLENDLKRRNSSSTVEDENECSLGSIEEPDVLEYWEAETVEPLLTSKKETIQGELTDEDSLVAKDDGSNTVEHVQMYYRLQAGSSVTSTEDDACDQTAENENLNIPKLIITSDYSDETTDSTCSAEEVPVIVPEIKAKSLGDDGSRIPVDEAFEAYESYYTDRSLPFLSINQKFTKSRLFNRDEEGAIPCKAVCCNIQ